MKNQEQIFDLCIVGGGVAGCALASYLGKSGIQIAVIEKNPEEQDRIVGELLQPGGVEQLQKMNLDFLLNDIDAQSVSGYAMFLEGKDFRISYPETTGHLQGKGFRNGKFVQKMREYSFSLPNVHFFHGSAVSFIETDKNKVTGINYNPKDSEETLQIQAKLTVICDGAFSAFRVGLNKSEKKISSYFLGLIMKDCQLPYPGHGHVIIAEPSPVLCYPISSTETRALIDFPGGTPPKKGEELRKYLIETIGSQMPDSIKPSYFEAVNEGKFKVMPNHLLPAEPLEKAGAVLLGDSLNMRHPLTGGGMTVAFTDVYGLGSRLLQIKNFGDDEALAKVVAEYYSARNSENASINVLADALYGVMRNEDLKHACYDYLQRGGNYAAEPISILSAISRDFKLLLRHFFAVALFGSKGYLKPFPTPRQIMRSFRMIRAAVQIVSPLVLNQKPDRFTRTVFGVSRRIFN